MAATTWWGFATAVILIAVGWWVFRRWIIKKDGVKELADFRFWSISTAVGAAVLILLSSIPFALIYPSRGLNDFAAVASAIGPLALTVSVTLATIFYSVGEWYDSAQHFRALGITDAKPNRKGRQQERGAHWQEVLRSTNDQIVITGTTLGGWFVNGWEDTRNNLLEVLGRGAQVQVLLANPGGDGFKLRANDPGELAEAEFNEKASQRAKRVYLQIGRLFETPDFSAHMESGRLTFYVYPMTPLSVVWVDDKIYFATYLPCISDKACPEFSINRMGQMGATITGAIDRLIQESEKIESAAQAAHFADLCDQA